MYINFSFLTGGLMKIYASHFYVTLILKKMYPKPMLNSSLMLKYLGRSVLSSVTYLDMHQNYKDDK